MKAIFLIITIYSSWTFGSECKQVSYSAEDYEVYADHDNDLNKTCNAAGKSALWKACVNCFEDAAAGDSCRIGIVRTTPDDDKKLCSGFAEAKLSPCKGAENLVHCVDLAP